MSKKLAPTVWISDLVPSEIRADRGTEFAGREFRGPLASLGVGDQEVVDRSALNFGTWVNARIQSLFEQLDRRSGRP
jgi:hypothetical protein